MFLSLRGRRRVGAMAALAAATVGTLPLLVSPASAATPSIDRTSTLEARRVDRVKLSKLDWFECQSNGIECATIWLPLDYDEPNGRKTEVAVSRLKAADPKRRIGVLFVNPGGPGASSTDFVARAPETFDQSVLDRFDIVGVDPRGVGSGEVFRCFKTFRERVRATTPQSVGFPVTRAEAAGDIRSANLVAKGCMTTGRRLVSSMSTAEVARDMDVVRRTLGEKKLNFLGISYGSQLGQVYANMFPDRVRAIVLDAVINPVAWTTGVGNQARTTPVTARMKSADGTYAAFKELMKRCDEAGAPMCSFAGSGDSLKKFDTLARRLKSSPLKGGRYPLTYALMLEITKSAMYQPNIGELLTSFLQETYAAVDPANPASQRDAAGRRASAGIATLRERIGSEQSTAGQSQERGWAFAYPSGQDAYTSVICADSVNPMSPNAWIAAADKEDKRVPYFGRLWSWVSVPCAGSVWTARDEDRYMGPFNRRTANPVLVVGSYYDPATPYLTGAVEVSKMLPNSRLLTSNSWGHGAFGNNDCVAGSVSAYLLAGTLPAVGKVCTGRQPYEKVDGPPPAPRSGSTQQRPRVR